MFCQQRNHKWAMFLAYICSCEQNVTFCIIFCTPYIRPRSYSRNLPSGVPNVLRSVAFRFVTTTAILKILRRLGKKKKIRLWCDKMNHEHGTLVQQKFTCCGLFKVLTASGITLLVPMCIGFPVLCVNVSVMTFCSNKEHYQTMRREYKL